MKNLIKIVLCLALLAFMVSCQKEARDTTATIIGSEISDVAELDKALDTGEFDALDSDITRALEGLES